MSRPSHEQLYLDGGNRASARLNEAGEDASRVEWQFAQLEHEDVQLREGHPPVLVSPPSTQSVVSVEESKTIHLSDVYDPTRYLQTRHFDAYAPPQAILEGITADFSQTRSYAVFNGNPLSIVPAKPVRGAPESHFACCRTGKTGGDFSILRMQVTSFRFQAHTSSTPSTRANRQKTLISFPTPILDIASIHRSMGWSFGIRTASSLAFLELVPTASSSDVECEQPLVLKQESFAGHVPADFCLNPFPRPNQTIRQALVADRIGGVWETASLESVEKILRGGYKSSYAGIDHLREGDPKSGRSEFARISYGLTDRQAIVALEDAVRMFDLRQPENDTTLFQLSDEKIRILDMAKPSHEAPGTQTRVLVTTEEVIWIDIRKPGDPLLRYKHRREKDTTLSLSSVYAGGVYHTALWSRQSSLLTVFSYPANPPLQLLCHPYEIHPVQPGFLRIGVSLLHVSSGSGEKGSKSMVILCETGADGSLYQREMSIGCVADETGTRARARTGGSMSSQKVNRVELGMKASDAELRRHHVADLRKTYAKIFRSNPTLHDRISFTTAFPSSNLDSRSEAMHLPLEMTIVEQASESEEQRHFTPFTAAQALDRAAISLEALEDDYNNLSLHDEAAYTHHISSRLLGVNDVGNPQAVAEELRKLYGPDAVEAEGEAGAEAAAEGGDSRINNTLSFACEQLAVDLALSSAGFSNVCPEEPDLDGVDASMLVHGKLSALPAIEFGYFTPTLKAGRTSIDTPAARALLSEWKLGADPSVRPAFVNPYDEDKMQERVANKQFEAFRRRVAEGADMSASQPMPGATRNKKPRERPRAEQPARGGYSQEAAPAPLPAVAQPLAQTQTHIQIQPETQTQTPTQTQTQPAMPFSQIVPGAHGGRSMKKKRVGGF